MAFYKLRQLFSRLIHFIKVFINNGISLQILHCLEHSHVEGGETILVDGFDGATKLKSYYPKDYEYLTKFDVETEYLEDGHHYKFSAPVIKINEQKELKLIRFNVYDRSAMAFASRAECRAYYRALWNLSTYYQNTEYQCKFKLMPGLLLVVDNFGVLHGRTGFSGKGVLCRSYVSCSDWINEA